MLCGKNLVIRSKCWVRGDVEGNFCTEQKSGVRGKEKTGLI